MYGDDLIFGKANESNVESIGECLEEYGECQSGLANGLVKRNRLFTLVRVSPERYMRNDFCDVLKFKECNHKSKHLGLPFCKPATRVADFLKLIDRVDRKLQGWKSKSLAQVGRNVQNKQRTMKVWTWENFDKQGMLGSVEAIHLYILHGSNADTQNRFRVRLYSRAIQARNGGGGMWHHHHRELHNGVASPSGVVLPDADEIKEANQEQEPW
ncbi:hypothetical protein BUALT_Bualt01G0080300 [Buddleja alternifolia]|uniref:Reverse transcriptase n=1 Tax=Buddleja alternifolia TaxID=168488 RepID=A0AAV6YCB4_9LAMI|nr:hypothetical protein BUALT_Bualt01G0080300 [Buddleja alternifolia]